MKTFIMTLAFFISTIASASNFECGIKSSNKNQGTSNYRLIGSLTRLYGNLQAVQEQFEVTITKVTETRIGLSILDQVSGELVTAGPISVINYEPQIVGNMLTNNLRNMTVFCNQIKLTEK